VNRAAKAGNQGRAVDACGMSGRQR
jgi:hypothetical protein